MALSLDGKGGQRVMTPERWQQVKELLAPALEMDAASGSAFINQLCGTDESLRVDVNRLLTAAEQGGPDFLKRAVQLETDYFADAHTDIAESFLPPKNCAVDGWVGRRVGPYRILELIGAGGMGEVYRAIRADDAYRKQVAIKVVRLGQNTLPFLYRFKAERQILASLDHPNIARLLDGGTSDGLPYFVMELIHGRPIDEYCRQSSLTVRERLSVFLKVCSAVQFAHQHLIVHRDLKPGNILVTEEGEPKLLDFGIAKILSPTAAHNLPVTMTAIQAFTPRYASPEQVRREPISTATDVYSLAVILYELLTGHSPYPLGTTAEELAKAVSEIDPEKPSVRCTKAGGFLGNQETRNTVPSVSVEIGKLTKDLQGDLDNIILMAMRKEPARRYSSVEQFAEDIRRHLEHLPVKARKDTFAYRASKFVVRHRTGVVGSVAAVLLLIATLAVTIREANIAQQERVRAERRFNDVRQLANSLIFEIHDSLSNVPGATAARKLIVERALRYLDSLTRESSSDVSLERELAAAYVRIGKVQGGADEPNVGNTSASLESYQKALQIRKAVHTSAPNDLKNIEELSEAYRSVAESQEEIGSIEAAFENTKRARELVEHAESAHQTDVGLLQELVRDYESEANLLGGNFNRGTLGDSSKALAQRQKELDTSERIAKLRPDDPGVQKFLAISVTQMGDQLLLNGQWREAFDYYLRAKLVFERLVAQSANSREETEDLHAAYQRLQFIDLQKGQTEQAVQDCRKALQIAEKLSRADPNDVWSRANLANDYGNLAGALSRAHQSHEAQVAAQKAINLIHGIVSHDPKNTELQGVLSAALASAGGVYRRSGEYQRALAYYRQALTATESIVATDAKDVGSRMRLAADHNNLAAALYQSGDLAGAIGEYREAAKLVQVTHPGSTTEEGLYASANALTGLGDIESRLAKQNSDVRTGPEHRQKACDYYQASLKVWSKVHEPGVLSPDGFESVPPGVVSMRADKCGTAAASP
jgi:eukaryotic-like serine/threonine-protein kinase